ncbi:hypothetical protein BH18ACT1_BH18ACT1_16750 [soil metagenome]
MPTHYEVLGVARTASPEEVRRAYVTRARALHPDRHMGTAPAAAARTARAMQDVNEGWRVLRTPSSRSAYDARLRGGVQTAPATTPGRRRFPTDAEPDEPFWHEVHAPHEPGARVVRSLPWVAMAVVLAAIFVFTAFAGGVGEDDDGSASRFVDRCVSSERAGQLEVVPCTDRGAERVDLVVLRASACPSGSSALPYGESWLCLRPAGVGTSE